jgi:hypothetical protein
METIAIFSNRTEIAKAVGRYLKFVQGFEDIFITPLIDPYGRKNLYEIGLESDLLIIDAFAQHEPEGFRFAKEMEKKVLLMFYPGEVEIEESSSFCLLLPEDWEIFPNKIKKILSSPPPGKQDYESLEQRFPILKRGSNHHGHHC